MKPTDVSRELGEELVKIFGSREAVPAPLLEAAWLLHMRLVEADDHLAYFRERLAEYTQPAAPRSTAQAARLVLGEGLLLEVELGGPYRVGGVIHERVQFDLNILTAPGVVEALTKGATLRLLLPDGSERSVCITNADSLWQGKFYVAL
jgi:hypothetical protein